MAAALYVDPLGPYPKIAGVDCWDEKRDARLYEGPRPIVAHPPCGPWSKLRHLCNEATLATADCGPRAVEQVRRWGGVLEHPAHSMLWAHCGLPKPVTHAEKMHRPISCLAISVGQGCGDPEHWHEVLCPADQYGYSIQVDQVEWGHVARKPTWLYLVGVPGAALGQRPFPGREPTHCICTGPRQLKRLPVASKPLKRRTPPLFAEWLVSLARASKVTR